MPTALNISAILTSSEVPWQALTSKAYAKAIAAEIDVNKAKPSSQIRPGKAGAV